MHTHKFGDTLFQRLQAHAEPFVDTIDDVINRALDALEAVKEGGAKGKPQVVCGDEAKSFNAASPPSLTHTVPRTLSVDGHPIEKDVYWNTLLFEVIAAAGRKKVSPAQIIDLLQVPAKAGKHDGSGYRFVPDAGISFQQLNSDRAWSAAFRIASKVGIAIAARWIWLQKDKAHLPGALGVMRFPED